MPNSPEVSFVVRVKDYGSAVLNQLGGTAASVTDKILSFGSILKGLGAAAAGISLGAIVKDIIDLGVASDATFRGIAAALPTGVAGIGQLRDELKDLAIESGRSLDEVQALGAEIAKMGVSSAAGVSQEAKAAILLSDATGASAQESAQLLIQLRREFGQTDDQALKTAADLAAAARGRADISELFAVFQRSAPVFQKFSIDAETGTRAIVALVAAGHNARSIGSDLGKMDATGIRELAIEAKVSADSLEDLRTRAALVEDGTSRASQRIKTEFQATLEKIGTTLAEKVNPYLKAFSELLDPVTRKADQVADAFKSLETGVSSAGGVSTEQQDAIGNIERLLHQKGANPQQLFAGQSPDDLQKVIGVVQALNAVTGEHAALLTTLGSALDRATEAQNTNADAQQKETEKSAQRIAKIIAASEARVAAAKKLDEEKAKIAALGVEFDRLSAVDDKATSKSQQFGLAIEAYKQRAEAAHLPTTALNSDLEVLNTKLEKLKSQDAQNLADSIAKALGELTGNTADAASGAIEKQVQDWKDAVAVIDTYDAATALALTDAINKWEKLKPAVDAAAESVRKAQATIATIQGQGADVGIDTLGGDQTAAQARMFDLEDQRRRLLAAGATSSSKEYLEVQRQIDAVEKELESIGKRILTNTTGVVKPAKDTLQTLTEQARAIRDAVDGALQLGAAFHLVSQNTATVLRDVAEIVTQIPVFAKALGDFKDGARDEKGNLTSTLATVIGAGLPVLGGVASLVTSLTAESPAEQAHKKAIEANSAAILQLTKGLASLSISGTAFASGSSLVQAILSGQTGQMVQKNFGHGAGVDFIAGLTADQLGTLNDFAKALGITFDGTSASLRQLQQAAEAAGMFLGKLGTDYSSEQTYYSGLADVQGLNPQDAFNVNALAGASQSPLLAQLLGGANLNTQAGRDALKKQLQDAFQRGGPNSSNPFTLQEMGGLNPEQMEAAIKQWVDSLNSLPPLVVSAADKLKGDLATLGQKTSVLGESPVQALVDKVKTYATDLGPAFAQLAEGLDLTKQAGIDTFNERLKEFYQSMLDGTANVDTSTFSLDDWKSAIADVSGAVSAAAGTFESAANKINDSLNAIDVAANIEGTSPEAVIQQKAKVQGFGVLGNYDLTTQAGRDAAKAELKSIFENGLSPTDSNYAAWSATISGLLTSINQLPAIGGGAAGSMASIPSLTDTYNQSAQATVTSISASEATGILGEIQTSNSFLAAIRDLVSQLVSPGALGASWSGRSYGAGAGAGAGGSNLAALAQSIGPIVVPIYLDGKQVGQAVAASLLDPAVYQAFDRGMTRGANRVKSGLGLPRT